MCVRSPGQHAAPCACSLARGTRDRTVVRSVQAWACVGTVAAVLLTIMYYASYSAWKEPLVSLPRRRMLALDTAGSWTLAAGAVTQQSRPSQLRRITTIEVVVHIVLRHTVTAGCGWSRAAAWELAACLLCRPESVGPPALGNRQTVMAPLHQHQ